MHIVGCMKDIDSKRAPKVGTQHATVEEEEISVASIDLEDDVMPSREEMLKVMGYQETNVALSKAEIDGEYKSTWF